MRENLTKHTFNIGQAAEELVPNKANRNAYLGATLLAIGCLAVTGFLYARLPERLPLLLTSPWGEARLVPKIALIGGGVMIILVNALNITLGKLWGGSDLIPRILSVTAIVFAIAISLGIWGVVQSFFL